MARRKKTIKKAPGMYRVKFKVTQSGTSKRLTAEGAKKLKALIKQRTPNAQATIVRA